jgi:gas vesicle protein
MIRAPKETEEKLITNHMDFLRAYAKVLSTDITSLLSNAENRATTLDEHINILKNYGNTTNERLKILTEQSTDIKNFINKNSEEENIAKATLQNSL